MDRRRRRRRNTRSRRKKNGEVKVFLIESSRGKITGKGVRGKNEVDGEKRERLSTTETPR